MSLEYSLVTVAGVAGVRLSGRIDREAAGVLDAVYTESEALRPSAIELEFADVDYINSTGIALIVGLLAKARAAKIGVRASGLTAHYRHIFDITRLSDFIEIVTPAAH